MIVSFLCWYDSIQISLTAMIVSFLWLLWQYSDFPDCYDSTQFSRFPLLLWQYSDFPDCYDSTQFSLTVITVLCFP